MPQDSDAKRDEPEGLADAAQLVLQAAKSDPVPESIVKLAAQLEAALKKARQGK